MAKGYLFEIIFSIGLVIVAVLISNFNPLAAGLVAGLPIRVGTSLFLIGRANGAEALREAALGAVYGAVSVFIFITSLYVLLGKYPPNTSFLLSSAIVILYVLILFAGKKYGIV